MMNIVIFSGGRGNKTLLKALQSQDSKGPLKVNVIVNGLDDGASTGAIREMFGNRTHGISDFLKVAVAMSPMDNLAQMLEERVPALENTHDQLKFSKELHDFIYSDIDLPFLVNYKDSDNIKDDLRQHTLSFIDYFYRSEGLIPNISDFKLGNIVFASMLADNHLDFQKSLVSFMQFCSVNLEQFGIVQSTESNSYLVGILKNGSLLPNEASVVLTRTNDFIYKTFQLPRPLTATDIRTICSSEIEGKTAFLESRQVIPTAGAPSLECIKGSDAIIYGAGTPYSSLLPSLELNGMAEAIGSVKCPKILVINLIKETSNTMVATDLIDKVIDHLRISIAEKNNFDPRDYITHIVVPNDLKHDQGSADYILTNQDDIRTGYEWIKVVQADIRSSQNPAIHDGEKLKECLLSIINAR